MKLFEKIGLSSIFLGMFIVLLITYWMVRPYTPINFKDTAFKITSRTVKQGGNIQYIENYCKSMPVVVTRAFIDSIIFAVPYFVDDRYIGCQNKPMTVPVPMKLPPGEYYLEITFTAKPNPLRRIQVVHETEHFIVEIP